MKLKLTPVLNHNLENDGDEDVSKFALGYEVSKHVAKDDSWEYLGWFQNLQVARNYIKECLTLPPEEFFE